MKPAAFQPLTQVFVCTHARAPTDPLRSGCGAAGPAVFTALKRASLEQRLPRNTWVTATGCMGLCPASGCSVAVMPRHQHYVEVTADDVEALVGTLRGR